jgi:phosphatidylglycerol:prolipoprotein diacylglycerol transferase
MTDMCATVAPFGFFIGRFANFINGELYGKITDVPWAVIFPNSAASIDFAQPRHPSQLYECALEGLILLIYMQIRFWASKTPKGERSNCDAKNSNEKTKFSYVDGILTSEFLILYGIFRIFVEIFREPDADLICGMSRGQFYSIFLIFIGIALRIFLIKKQKKSYQHIRNTFS